MRIKGTKKHMLDHQRGAYRKYKSYKCWYTGKRNLFCGYGEHDPSRIKHAKRCEKFHQKEFLWELHSQFN